MSSTTLCYRQAPQDDKWNTMAPRSPDVNPDENLWGFMVQMWQELRIRNYCSNIVNSMRERFDSVIAADSGYKKFVKFLLNYLLLLYLLFMYLFI